MWLGKETLSNIIIGDFNLPFGTYSSFDAASLASVGYRTYIQQASATSNVGATVIFGDTFNIGPTYFDEGSNTGSTSQALSENKEEYSFSSSGYERGSSRIYDFTEGQYKNIITSSSRSTNEDNVTQTAFLPNIGFEIRANSNTDAFTISLYFDDTDVGVYALYKERKTNKTLTDAVIRTTKNTNIPVTIIDIPTNYSDVTTEYTTVNRVITTTETYTSYGYGVAGDGFDIFCNSTSGLKMIIEPNFGSSWTQDGGSLQYLQVCDSVGTLGPFYTYLKKDNVNTAINITPESSILSANVGFAIQSNNVTYTLISGSTQTITYEYISNGGTISVTFPTQYSLNNSARFESYQIASASRREQIPVTSSFTQLIALESTFNPVGTRTGFSYGFCTTTKAISIFTTIAYNHTDQFYSYFSTFTYKALKLSTAESSYVLFADEQCGNSSETFLSSTSVTYYTVITGEEGDLSSSSRYFSRSAYTIRETVLARPKTYYKSFYSLRVQREGKYEYTQKSPPFNFVVGGTSASIGTYKALLEPLSALTKLYFTTYKFERGGAINAPKIAMPINYTNQSGSSYTYQVVNVPNEFYLGSGTASVYWTRYISEETTRTTESFELSYAGFDSTLTMGYFGQSDIVYSEQTWSPLPVVYHTKGLVNTADAASWIFDGYYYWRGTARDTSGTTSDAIVPLGDGNPYTHILSEWVDVVTYPVVTITKTHLNSYT